MAEKMSFDASLYSAEAVEAAAEAYADYAKIEVTTGAQAVDVVLDDAVEHDPKMLANAFMNHVLHETISRRRQSAVDEVD